ncbi:MAG: VOC family protein [Gemmatimonadota bacterium]|nr:VOC family protein [Gemmatimonadota bacterium]
MKADLLHTMIRVKDLDRSVAFYTEVLGLTERRRKVLEGADATLVFLADEDGHHPIELTYNHDGRDYELGDQFGHLAFGVPDLEEARSQLARHGVEFTRGPYRVGEGGSTIAFIEDPDGIEIELIETGS